MTANKWNDFADDLVEGQAALDEMKAKLQSLRKILEGAVTAETFPRGSKHEFVHENVKWRIEAMYLDFGRYHFSIRIDIKNGFTISSYSMGDSLPAMYVHQVFEARGALLEGLQKVLGAGLTIPLLPYVSAAAPKKPEAVLET